MLIYYLKDLLVDHASNWDLRCCLWMLQRRIHRGCSITRRGWGEAVVHQHHANKKYYQEMISICLWRICGQILGSNAHIKTLDLHWGGKNDVLLAPVEFHIGHPNVETHIRCLVNQIPEEIWPLSIGYSLSSLCHLLVKLTAFWCMGLSFQNVHYLLLHSEKTCKRCKR